MADRFPTVIRLGGEVSRALLPDLIAAINSEDLEANYGVPLPRIKREEQLHEYLEPNSGALVFYDENRAWGGFDDLEEFLFERSIPFDRQHAGRYEYSGELVQFRPGMAGPQCAEVNDSGQIVVLAKEVQSVRDLLKNDGVAALAQALEKLNACCIDIDVAPLPKFQIVD
jgi:hypothetical protein